MGVSGCGKSTIGQALALGLGIEFYDGDDFHTESNINKMANGVALEDADRLPWLKQINEFALKRSKGQSLVIACSALKEEYRTALSQGVNQVKWIYLKGNRGLIQSRIEKRANHFMPKGLLDSQFETLEEPIDAITINVESSKEEIVQDIISKVTI